MRKIGHTFYEQDAAGLARGVIGTVLAFPFLFLLPERTKRNRVTLGVAAASTLVGLLGEGLLLVLPALGLSWGWPPVVCVVFVPLGAVGLVVLTVGSRLAQVGAQASGPDLS